MSQKACPTCNAVPLPNDYFCWSCGTKILPAEGLRSQRTSQRRPIAIFLMAFGGIVGAFSYLMGIVPMLAFGLAALLIGIIALYMPESVESYAGSLERDSSLPSLLNLEKLLEDLELNEKGIYIPVSGIGVCPRVFVPLADTVATRTPPLALNISRRIFVTVGNNPVDRGILLDAPGSQILAALERSLHVDLSQVQLSDLSNYLESGLKALGIAKAVTFDIHDSAASVRISLANLSEFERQLRNKAPRLVAQVGTPLSSASAAAVAKATQKYVTFRSAILEPAEEKLEVRVTLQLNPIQASRILSEA